MKNFSLLRAFIKEEIGRSFKTINTSPYTFRDFQDYNIEIKSSATGGFFLSVFFKDSKIFPTQRFETYEEADHASRMVVDKDRVKRMNHGKKEKN